MNPPRRQLTQNAIKVTTPKGPVYLRSSHVHDFVSYGRESGKGVYACNDGGLEYLHRTVGPHQEDWDLYTDSPFEEVCRKALWGTYGPKGKGPLVIKPLAECDLDHLKAILATQMKISPLYVKVVKHWIAAKEKA